MGTVRAMWKWLVRIGIVGIAVFALIQLVPYGWTHSNPAMATNPTRTTPFRMARNVPTPWRELPLHHGRTTRRRARVR